MASKTITRPTAAQRTLAAREARARRIMRTLAIVGGVPVFVVCAIASYFHICSLASEHGQSQSAAHLLPISIDGAMIVAAIWMIAHRGKWLPRLAFGLGAAFTLTANALSVHQADPIAYGCAIAPAVFMLATAEGLLRLCLPTPARRSSKRPTRARVTRARRSISPQRSTAGQPAVA